MRPIKPRNFNSFDLSANLTDEATPQAQASLLQQADAWPVDVAVSPYCGCAHVFDGLSGTIYEDRFLAAVIAPGAVHARAAISRGFVLTAGSGDKVHETWSSDGGTTGNDVINVPWHLVSSLNYLPTPEFQYGESSIAVSGDSIIDAPTQPTDRQYELQTTGAPYVEPLYVKKAAGFSLVVSDQVADLESLP